MSERTQWIVLCVVGELAALFTVALLISGHPFVAGVTMTVASLAWLGMVVKL